MRHATCEGEGEGEGVSSVFERRIQALFRDDGFEAREEASPSIGHCVQFAPGIDRCVEN